MIFNQSELHQRQCINGKLEASGMLIATALAVPQQHLPGRAKYWDALTGVE